jgi:transmembrane sensor
MTPSSTSSRDAIADEAAAWFVQNRSGSLDPAARAAFMMWLRASPVHVDEYLAVAVVARDLSVAAADPATDLEALLAEASGDAGNIIPIDPALRSPARTPPGRWSHYWPRMTATAALLLVSVAIAVWALRDGERFGLPRTYSTSHAEQRVYQLPDGSLLHLNTDSEITVHFSGTERLVRLDRGQAFFEVVHQGPRPFRVEAGDARIVAVGTAFDVYRKSGDVLVTVADGTVQVINNIPPAGQATRVGAGFQVEVSERIGAPRRIDTRSAIAWLRRQIAFEDQPLGEVAAEFNRYGSVAFEIDDAAVRELPISGVFDAYDTDSFAAFLQTLHGVVVQKTPGRIRVRSLASVNQERQAAAH